MLGRVYLSEIFELIYCVHLDNGMRLLWWKASVFCYTFRLLSLFGILFEWKSVKYITSKSKMKLILVLSRLGKTKMNALYYIFKIFLVYSHSPALFTFSVLCLTFFLFPFFLSRVVINFPPSPFLIFLYFPFS